MANTDIDYDYLELSECLDDETFDDDDFDENNEDIFDCVTNVQDNFMLQMALSMRTNNTKYFISLFSPFYFLDISMGQKIDIAMAMIGSDEDELKQKKFLSAFIFNTVIDKFSFYSTDWRSSGFDKKSIDKLFEIKILENELDNLPMNYIKEFKKTKV